MGEIIKLNMFYTLVDAQVIWVMVNTRTYSSASTPVPVLSPTPTETAPAHVFKVDHLADAVTILTTEDLNFSPTSTKRVGKKNNNLLRPRILQN